MDSRNSSFGIDLLISNSTTFADAASWLLLAVGKSDLDLRWNVLYCYVDCWIADWSSLASCWGSYIGFSSQLDLPAVVYNLGYTLFFNKLVVSQISTGC